jgi:putative peptidoglycan lipid II flippase
MRGSFTAFDVSQSAIALAWYAPGLLFVGISRVVVPCFYAMKDTRTPVIISFWTLLVNLLAGLLLMQLMGHAGLALALTAASVFNAVILIVLLAKRLGKLGLSGIFNTMLRTIPGLICMSIVVTVILGQTDWLTTGPFLPRFALLFAAVLSGCLVYAAGLWLFRVKEMQQAWSMIAGRLPLYRRT